MKIKEIIWLEDIVENWRESTMLDRVKCWKSWRTNQNFALLKEDTAKVKMCMRHLVKPMKADI